MISPEKINVITDLERIRSMVESAGKFRTNYDDLLNVISGLNSRCSQYSTASRIAIRCDVIDNVISLVNFDELSTQLNNDIIEKAKPKMGLQWLPLTTHLTDLSLDNYQMDEIESMKLYLPPEGTKLTKKNKKDVVKFLDAQRRAVDYSTQFLNEFSYFEDTMQSRRDTLAKEVLSNIPYLVNEHYKEVYKYMMKNGEYTIPEKITIETGLEIPFKNKQSEFLKGAIKTICEAYI